MKDWDIIENNYIEASKEKGYTKVELSLVLQYIRKLYDNRVPVLFDAHHLEVLTGIEADYLYAVCNRQDNFYRTFNISKRNGKSRTISEPLPILKEVQKWILENILNQAKISPYAKAFVKKKSIKENARFHRNQDFVISMDIKDFFPTINFDKIVGVFEQLGYHYALSIMLANICSLNASLPQGAPSSPAISNIIMLEFDEELAIYCKNKGLRYTRYADDITISGNVKLGKSEIINFVRKLLWKEGFLVNSSKTKVLRKYQRQLVTGIVVNEKMQAPKEYRKQIRQEVYYIKTYGVDSHLEYKQLKKKKYLYHLLGKIQHVLMVNPRDKDMIIYRKYISDLISLTKVDESSAVEDKKSRILLIK